MNKIKEKGSLYGKVEELAHDSEQNPERLNNPIIAKPETFLKDKLLDNLYYEFEDQIKQIREDEEKQKLIKKQELIDRKK